MRQTLPVKGVFMRTRIFRLSLVILLLALGVQAPASVIEEDPNPGPEAAGARRGILLEYLTFEDYLYSQSKKTEIGDALRMDVGLRYQYSDTTFGRLRFATDPVENRYNNKTSKFEILGGHQEGAWYFQLDTEILTNETANGGTSIGLDLDSELTLVRYNRGDFDYTFYPFNFDGEVGYEFNTWDVTRLYFVEGAPSTVNPTPLGTEKVSEKTIPGFEVGWSFAERRARAYAGLGAASFLYPVNPAFNIETAPTADRWERREDVGYKAGFTYRDEGAFRGEFKYVGHTQSERTGSLLAAAGSLYGIGRLGRFVIENEWAYSKAGQAPYRLNRTGEWFEDQTPWEPVYSDDFGDRQDWIDKADFATSFRAGYERDDVTPYLTAKYQGPHFIFRERESAHRLRTADESESHGGLNRIGFGAFFYSGSFVVNPEFEWYKAKNPVFGNASDVRADRRLASFRDEDYQLRLTVSYTIGPNPTFKP